MLFSCMLLHGVIKHKLTNRKVLTYSLCASTLVEPVPSLNKGGGNATHQYYDTGSLTR